MGFVQQIFFLFLLLAAALIFYKLACRHQLYKPVQTNRIEVRTPYLLGSFAIYFFVFLALPPLLTMGYRLLHPQNLLSVFGWSQIFSCFICAFSLFRFSLCFNRLECKKIWKNSQILPRTSLSQDCLIGIGTWLIGFPLSLAVGQFFDLIIHFFFQITTYEQTAVKQLKIAFQSPPLLYSTLLSILVFAPIAEEFLFRGLLQNWLKKFLKIPYALIITSAIFALIHFSAGQGLGNIPLTTALFAFSCFLGFVYERQGSLFSSIALHMAFNWISTIWIFVYEK